MSAWKEPAKTKYMLIKDSSKTSGITYKGMIHKNSDLKGCGYENTWSSYGDKTIKVKGPEGNYEFKIVASYKTGQKVKGAKKKPIPEASKVNSAWEFTEVRIHMQTVKCPTAGVCEADVRFNGFKNKGNATDFDPWIKFDIDIRTGMPIPGTKWNSTLLVCDIFAASQKVVIR